MTCDSARLDEYLDGELDPTSRAGVEAHLAACEPCRAELERSSRLDSLLRRVPGGAPPDAERFLAEVRSRSRRPSPLRWAAAAAAALLLGAVALYAASRPASIEADVEAYLRSPSAALEERLKAGGVDALRAIEARLASADVRTQFAAASLLFRLADPAKDAGLLARVSARFQAPSSRDWVLSELGSEESDVETVPIAISAFEHGEAWSLDALRDLNRLHARGRREVVGAVVTLLKSDNPEIQKRALEIVKELEIDFPLTAVVDLLDSPELGEEARRILRRSTGKDFGRDKAAWREAVKETP
jgi:predicted anti-sigma-YlaC factor YlaD